MLGACMTCTEMCGNGAWMNGTRVMMEYPPMAEPGWMQRKGKRVKNQQRPSCCAAAPGATSLGAVGRLPATTTIPTMPFSASVSVWSASPRALPSTLNPSIPQHSAVFNSVCWFAAVSLRLGGYRLRAVPGWRRRRLDFMALHAFPASPSSSGRCAIRVRKARNRARLVGEGSSCTRAESSADRCSSARLCLWRSAASAWRSRASAARFLSRFASSAIRSASCAARSRDPVAS